MHQIVQMVQVTHDRHDHVRHIIMLKMYANNTSIQKSKMSLYNLSAIDTFTICMWF